MTHADDADPAIPGTRKGHRTGPHTADVMVEAWAPDRTACLEELVRGLVSTFAATEGVRWAREIPFEIDTPLDEDVVVALLEDVLYLLDVDGLVPVAVEIEEDTESGSLAGRFLTAPVTDVVAVGAAPKGISRAALEFWHDADGWRGRVIVDV